MAEDTTQVKPNVFLKRQEDQELRIYFFVGNQPPQMVAPFLPGPPAQSDKPSSQVFYVVAFKLEEAFELAKVKGAGYNLLFTAQSPTVREFLRELEIESLANEALAKTKDIPKVEKKEPARIELEPVKMDFEKFKAGLLFCANEKAIIYQHPEDKETLKKIISGLSYRT